MQALYSSWFARQGAGATLADMITGALTIAAPLFWFMLMGSLGVVSASFIGSVLGSLGSVSNGSAKTGASIASSAVKTGINVAEKIGNSMLE